MTKAQIILELVDGAYGLAMKKERDSEVAKEWAQEAILMAIKAYDRYQHLPSDQLIKVLGRTCANAIYSMERKEVEKDKREQRFNEEAPDERVEKVMDDGHYEPFQHKVSRKKPNLAFVPPHEFEDPLEVSLSRELLAVLLTRLEPDERTFVIEKLNPSEAVLAEAQQEGYSHPLDKHIFPDKSKAMISRIKSTVKEWIDRLSVLSIAEL